MARWSWVEALGPGLYGYIVKKHYFLEDLLFFHIYLKKPKCMVIMSIKLFTLIVKFVVIGSGFRVGPIWSYIEILKTIL